MASTACTESQVEKETPWIDAWVRWERDSKEVLDNHDDDDNDAPASPTDTFSFRYPHNNDSFIHMELQGFPPDSEQIWNSTGLTLWRSSHYLCEYLLEHPELLKDSQITELGSGLGRCGILAHCMAVAKHVFVTDGDTDTLVQLRNNVERNKADSTISCHQLLWGRQTALKFVERHGKQDFIMGSDLVYVPSVLSPLFETARALLEEEHGVFLMAHCHRREGSSVNVEMVLEASETAYFEHELVQKEDDISLFIFRQRADAK